MNIYKAENHSAPGACSTAESQNLYVSETVVDKKTTFLREVTTVYRGPRRATARISEPKSAADFIRKILPDNSREHFVALFLDGGHKIIAFSVISTGTANCCPVHPREVFQNAILVGAVAIIVAHNHPSGDPSPSQEDGRVTRILKEAGKLLGIKFLDHVIIGDQAIHSFADALAL